MASTSILARLGYITKRPMLARAMVRQGATRAHDSLLPVFQAAAATTVAFLVSRYVLRHPDGLFAALAAWACLGFTFERELRRILEIAVGVVMGVVVGDFVVDTIGSGWWQMASVLFVAVILARFIDRGTVLASWAGTQSVVIVMTPNLTHGPWGRALDAAVGACVALLVVLLTPGDPQRQLRRTGASCVRALAETVEMIAVGIRTANDVKLDSALIRGREAQPLLTEWLEQAQVADDLSRVSANRRKADRFIALENQALNVERAMHSVRIIARRAGTDLATASAQDRARLADLITQFAGGITCLERAVLAGQQPSEAKVALRKVAAQCDPHGFSRHWGTRSTVLLLRVPVTDTLVACGMREPAARRCLHSLRAEPTAEVAVEEAAEPAVEEAAEPREPSGQPAPGVPEAAPEGMA